MVDWALKINDLPTYLPYLCCTAEPQQLSSAAEIQGIIVKADSLYNNQRYAELLAFTKEYADSDNEELLWRLARALHEKAKVTDDKAVKKQLLYEAFEVIERALSLNDKSAACHKVRMQQTIQRMRLTQ